MAQLDERALEAVRQSDLASETCWHIAIYHFQDGTAQCKDCLRKWPAEKPTP